VKKLISLLLLFILFLPSVGTSLWFMHRQKQIRKEVKHLLISGLADSELAHFAFTDDDITSLEWRHDKEFRLDGYMYDIVKREKIGEIHHFWCWKDDKETSLYQQFDSLLAKLNLPVPEDQQNTLKWLQFQNTLFCNVPMGWTPNFIISKRLQVVIPYSNLYHSITLATLSPPPLVG